MSSRWLLTLAGAAAFGAALGAVTGVYGYHRSLTHAETDPYTTVSRPRETYTLYDETGKKVVGYGAPQGAAEPPFD